MSGQHPGSLPAYRCKAGTRIALSDVENQHALLGQSVQNTAHTTIHHCAPSCCIHLSYVQNLRYHHLYMCKSYPATYSPTISMPHITLIPLSICTIDGTASGSRGPMQTTSACPCLRLLLHQAPACPLSLSRAWPAAAGLLPCRALLLPRTAPHPPLQWG